MPEISWAIAVSGGKGEQERISQVMQTLRTVLEVEFLSAMESTDQFLMKMEVWMALTLLIPLRLTLEKESGTAAVMKVWMQKSLLEMGQPVSLG